MGLTVREALSLNALKGAVVVAGHAGLDNPIRWTHIIDHPEVATWVKGGEVLLTSGLGIYKDIEAQVRYMREAAQVKVAAVLVATEEYLPQTTTAMREIADKNAIPLIELPRTTLFIEVTEAILRHVASKSAESARDYLIDALIAGNLPESAETLARLAELGLKPDRPHVITLTQIATKGMGQSLSESETRTIMAAINNAPRRAIVVPRTNCVLAIFPLSAREHSPAAFSRSLSEALEENSEARLRVGMSGLAMRLSDFKTRYREARDALFIANLIPDPPAPLCYDDLGVWSLLLRIEEQSELRRMVDHYLTPLVDHDREQQTDWVGTLEAFLNQNGNLRATARQLNLHRNTITYQLEHIKKLTGLDLDSAEVRLNLQVAFKIQKLLAEKERKYLHF
jgi:sugar diacid utilization regulator